MGHKCCAPRSSHSLVCLLYHFLRYWSSNCLSSLSIHPSTVYLWFYSIIHEPGNQRHNYTCLIYPGMNDYPQLCYNVCRWLNFTSTGTCIPVQFSHPKYEFLSLKVAAAVCHPVQSVIQVQQGKPLCLQNLHH